MPPPAANGRNGQKSGSRDLRTCDVPRTTTIDRPIFATGFALSHTIRPHGELKTEKHQERACSTSLFHSFRPISTYGVDASYGLLLCSPELRRLYHIVFAIPSPWRLGRIPKQPTRGRGRHHEHIRVIGNASDRTQQLRTSKRDRLLIITLAHSYRFGPILLRRQSVPLELIVPKI